MQTVSKQTIVIVGGGAGGLELVARLCKQFRQAKHIEIILIDRKLKHIWKPLFHEVAAGTYHDYQDAIDYISYAYQTGFKFVFGELREINTVEKWIVVEGSNLEHSLPAKKIHYDLLILALGSQSNDFNIQGVTEHCLLLDNLAEAEYCHNILLQHIVQATQGLNEHKEIHINIVGAGATGVELAAEFNAVLQQMREYAHQIGLTNYQFIINLIEASQRILSNLPERISHAVTNYLQAQHINVLTNTKIKRVEKHSIITQNDECIASDMTIWAGGVKGNIEHIRHHLTINRLQQINVRPTLQSITDDNIFALGDCAHCIDKKGNAVPPRAQAAHQQAKFLVQAIVSYLQHKPLPNFSYKDYGSLISLSHNQVIGTLMSRIAKSLYIEGWFARLTYWFLYKKHLYVLFGFKYTLQNVLIDLFRRSRPEIKLH